MMYYFDILENETLIKDEFGIQLASDEDARIEAQSLAIEIMRAYTFSANRKSINVEVRRDEDLTIYVATLQLTGRWASDLAQAAEPTESSCLEPWMLQGPVSDTANRKNGLAIESGERPSLSAS